MQWLELKIPPLLVWLVFAGAMLGVAYSAPRLSFTLARSSAIALALFALGAGVTFAGVIAFRHKGTTVNPLTPGASSFVVSNGVCRVSRNPMYLGFLLGLAGWAVKAFVAKLNSDLSSIVAATFLGGTGRDVALGLALDTKGSVYVAGGTLSSDFPGVGPSSADSTFAGREESFVVKLNSDLSSILAATFLGGDGSDAATALGLDSTGDVYVVGNTGSSDFPGVGPGSADSAFAGIGEGFVAKLNSDLSSILAATFLGGSDGDGTFALAP